MEQVHKSNPIKYSLLRELLINKVKVLTNRILPEMVRRQEYATETEYIKAYITRL